MSAIGKAVHIREAGGPEVLQIRELSLPSLEPQEVRIKVHAAGLNRADCLQRRGVYPAPPTVAADVPGLEYAGIIEACGAEVKERQVGERVMGIAAGGAMATHLIAHAQECVQVPDTMSLEEAAGIPEAFFTAYDALVLQGEMKSGERVLVHAAGSGVGTAAIQLAKARGATAIGTSRTEAKLERCKALGLEHAIHTSGGVFADEVRALGGAHVVLDTIGAKYLKENLRALAPKGRMVVIGLLGGIKGELNLGALLQKRARIFGSVLRSRPLEEKIALARRFEDEVLPLFGRGALRPVIDAVMNMEDVSSAHARMEAGETFGKLVMRW